MPEALNRLSDVISPLLGALIFFGIAWTVWESAVLSRMLNLSTNILYLPKAWFQYVMVVMSIITGVAMLLRAAEAAISGKPAPHEREPAI
jgi:TRAP-type C4-dicarboxylate transport system permease small subunit